MLETALDTGGAKWGRFERPLQAARWITAAAALSISFVPELRTAALAFLGFVLLLYSGLLRLVLKLAETGEARRRVIRFTFVADLAIGLFSLIVFSPDLGALAIVLGSVVIVAGALALGADAGLLIAAGLSLGFVMTASATATEAAPDLVGMTFAVLVYLGIGLVTGGAIRELTAERATRERSLRAASDELALRDATTGLPTMRLLLERLRYALVAGRRDEQPVGVLVLDLQHIAALREGLGDDAMQAVLRLVGARLVEELRETDTVAYPGGDRFVLVLPKADSAGSSVVSRKILMALERPFHVGGQAVEIEVAIGVAAFPLSGEDSETLLQRADAAASTAARTSLGYAVDTSDRPHRETSHLTGLAEVRGALERDEMRLFYQPLVDLRSGRMVGAEALLRWHPPGAEVRAPGDFLRHVEQTRLIHPLFEWVFVTALRTARLWNVDGRALPVSVNLSARNLLDPTLAETVTRLLGAERGLPSWIKFEITESMLMLDVARAHATLRRLRDLGFGLALDDFGTGYSSLSYLQQLPVDELKIDRSFVSRAVVDPGSLAIVRATIELGHALGLRVVAEGVEDTATWEAMRELGCDFGQGYLFGHPVPAEDLDLDHVVPLG